MLNYCDLKINDHEYKGAIKSGSANSAFEKIKITVYGDPILIEETLTNAKQIEVKFREEFWVFGYSGFQVQKNKNKDFEFEFSPTLIRRG